VQDSWRVDYRATLHTLQAVRSLGAAHFVLLSAVCVQKPLLEFQRERSPPPRDPSVPTLPQATRFP
jgi:divinyl chlorophyllide a 8-vinyl-reductase